ncbi:MAG: MFS transporter, partial [Mycobacterium sp.]
ALVAVLLQRSTGATGVPAESAFVVIFVIGAVTAALALVLIAVSHTRGRATESPAATVDSRAMNHEWG